MCWVAAKLTLRNLEQQIKKYFLAQGTLLTTSLSSTSGTSLWLTAFLTLLVAWTKTSPLSSMCPFIGESFIFFPLIIFLYCFSAYNCCYFRRCTRHSLLCYFYWLYSGAQENHLSLLRWGFHPHAKVFWILCHKVIICLK